MSIRPASVELEVRRRWTIYFDFRGPPFYYFLLNFNFDFTFKTRPFRWSKRKIFLQLLWYRQLLKFGRFRNLDQKLNMTGGDNNLWVFGYGSLCWHPGFDYGDQVIGHIKGFARKFWQGNTTHRGTDDKVSSSMLCLTGSTLKYNFEQIKKTVLRSNCCQCNLSDFSHRLFLAQNKLH